MKTRKSARSRGWLLSQRICPIYHRTRQFFKLPRCYSKVRAFKECRRPSFGLAIDLLTLFFSYKTFPDHYGPCWLWEVDKREWKYYYGSNYHPHQHLKLRTLLNQPEYRFLLDDKFVCAMFCKAIGLPMPHTLGLIDPGEDYRNRIRSWLAQSRGQPLIIKPIYGRAGIGVALAVLRDDAAEIRSGTSTESLDRFALKDKSIVQEYLRQHAAMASLSPSSVNTIRIVTMLNRQGNVIIVNASLRAGVGASFVDNFSAGGVSAGVDRETGRVKKFAYDRDWKRYQSHPQSGVVFKDFVIPAWDRVRGMAVAVQKAIPFYRMLGLDVAIGEKGEPILIEINGAPDLMGLEQKAGPLLKNEAALCAFGEYDLLINRHQRKLHKSANCSGFIGS